MTTQLSMGIKVEREHAKTVAFIKSYFKRYGKFPPNAEIYKSIAKDHLREYKDYYTRLKEANL